MAITSDTDGATAEPGGEVRQVDAVVIGAGFSGLYLNWRLRDTMGLDVQVIEAGDEVGAPGSGTGTPAPAATPRATCTASPSTAT